MASESLSLAETNKVRISLGLAPLVDNDDGEDGGAEGAAGGSDVDDDPDTLAEANWAQRRGEDKRAREEKEAKERLTKARNQRELRAKLEGKSLGAAEDTNEGGSAADWIKKSRKAAKARAIELEKLKQREKELEERDRDALKYGEDDLVGLKVRHGVEDFEEGQDVILTLKDGKVLEDDGELIIDI
jgi:U4/U6.U5 tri-snRNP-associated protein 1